MKVNMEIKPPTQGGKETSTKAEQNDIMIQEIQQLPLKFDSEEIRKL